MKPKQMPRGTRRGPGRLIGPGLLLLGLLVFDLAAFEQFDILGVRPELIVVFVCTVALQSGPATGLLVGAAAGLLVDLSGGHLIGLSVLSFAAAAAAAGSFSVRMFADRWVIVLTAVALGTVAEQIVYAAGALAFGFQLSLPILVTRILPVLLLYHSLLAPLVYPLGRWVSKTLASASAET